MKSKGEDPAVIGPLVSVVIPTRNRATLAARAVRSALSQSYSKIEVIVVVDGGDPSGYEDLRAIPDSRLRIQVLPRSAGGGEARNIGIRQAAGEWIALLDDDDEWLPGKLSQQMAVAARTTEPDALICCQYFQRTGRGQIVRPTRGPRAHQPISEYLFCEVPFFGARFTFLQTSTWLAPRDLFLRIPFDPAVRMNDDTDWLLRAIYDPVQQITIVPEPLSIYHCEASHERMNTSPIENQAGETSLRWARSRRGLFTPKAFTSFLVTQCLAQAVAARRGWPTYSALLNDCRSLGALSSKTLWLFLRTTILFPALKFCLPHAAREALRNFKATPVLDRALR